MTPVLSRQRLSNQIYEILKEMIADYRFSPGTRINVEQFAKKVGPSRTPVWEAVHRLIQEGLLENIPNRGVFMVTLKPEKAIELYEVRDALEGLAARLAAENIDAKILKKIKNNPQYLAEQNIKVLGIRDPQKKEIDPETIDWSGIIANTLAYRFCQAPGPLNPLGRIKFMLPNQFEVYLQL